MSTTKIGVSNHPQRRELEALWREGHRAAYLRDWLKINGYDVIKKSAIESYGRRYWKDSDQMPIVITIEDDDGEMREVQWATSDIPSGESQTLEDRVLSPYDTDGMISDTADDIKAAEEILKKIAESNLGTVKNIKIGAKSYPAWKREEGSDFAVSEMGSSRMRQVEIIPNAGGLNLERSQRTEVSLDFQLVGERVDLDDGWKIGVFLPDMQIGYFADGDRLIPTHDEAAIDIAHQIMAQVEHKYGISWVVNAGDNLDLPAFSTHRSAPGYLDTTQDAINRASEEAAIQRALAPSARIAWIEGNHEQRLTNFMVDKAPQILGLSRAGEEEPAMSVPFLCRFDDYDVEWVGPYPDSEIWINDHLRFEHGSLYSSTAGATAAKYLKNGVSVGHGHTHRQEMLQETRHTRDGARTHFAGSPGCLCRVDGKVPSAKTGIDSKGAQSGGKVENWQQGLWVFAYQEDGKQLANIESVVSIWGGWARYEGRDFFATCDVNGDPLDS